MIDLHSHSTASDGALTPEGLLQRAREQEVRQLALTDHDTVSGVTQLLENPSPAASAVTLIPGVELSCVWGKTLIHVVGLAIDPYHEVLTTALHGQHAARQRRAELIGERLERYGFTGAYAHAAALADDGQIGRPHFARFLVEQGHVATMQQAFKRFLGAGKPGDVKLTWPALSTVVEWITASGGVAVLAHPMQYKMTATRRNALAADFKAAGGRALEVISGRQTPDCTRTLCRLAERHDLLASLGSDFHSPDTPWNELGCSGELPRDCRPVWSAWEQRHRGQVTGSRHTL